VKINGDGDWVQASSGKPVPSYTWLVLDSWSSMSIMTIRRNETEMLRSVCISDPDFP
jgi:hypothetical protein